MSEISKSSTYPQNRQQCKLIFAGCCPLTDDQLAQRHRLDQLSDEDLASVGLERQSLIDDYRHLHELAELKKQPVLLKPHPSKLLLKIKRRPKEVKPKRKFGFKLLNQLAHIDFDMASFSGFLERNFEIYPDYTSDPAMMALPVKEREKIRFLNHCDHLDRMYMKGDRTEAMEIVVDALIRFSKRKIVRHNRRDNGNSRIPRPI